MPTHDIIDNRREILVDHINRIPSSTEAARFAVGYFFGKPVERHEKGIAVVGSSNLTLSGVTHNTELNVVVQGNDNHAEREQIKELHPEGVKAVQDWMKKWFNSAGYKRLGKILADRWESPG